MLFVTRVGQLAELPHIRVVGFVKSLQFAIVVMVNVRGAGSRRQSPTIAIYLTQPLIDHLDNIADGQRSQLFRDAIGPTVKKVEAKCNQPTDSAKPLLENGTH